MTQQRPQHQQRRCQKIHALQAFAAKQTISIGGMHPSNRENELHAPPAVVWNVARYDHVEAYAQRERDKIEKREEAGGASSGASSSSPSGTRLRQHEHIVRDVYLNLPTGVSITGEKETQRAADGRALPELLKLMNF